MKIQKHEKLYAPDVQLTAINAQKEKVGEKGKTS